LGGGLLPPGLIHCSSAVPPEDVKKTQVTTLASPAALNEAVMLKSEFFVIFGVPMKCGLAAKIGAVRIDTARVAESIKVDAITSLCEFMLNVTAMLLSGCFPFNCVD
jgi:hypothetical protein